MARGHKKPSKKRWDGPLLQFRTSLEHAGWIRQQADACNQTVSGYIRDSLDARRSGYGLPPVLWQELNHAMETEGLSLPQLVSELLRREATRRIAARRAAGAPDVERRAGVTLGS